MNSPREPVTRRLPEAKASVQRQKHCQVAFSEALPSERNRITKAQCMLTDSTWYVWYLTCEILCRPEYSSLMAYELNKSYVRHETKKDLASLCLASKAMNDLATPFLYRSLSFEMLEDTLVGNAGDLLYRLLDTSHDSPRCFVREITISPYLKYTPSNTPPYVTGRLRTTDTDKQPLSQLIQCLPNLRQVRLGVPCDLSDSYMTSIDEHPQKPELHLLAGDGEKSCLRSLPSVTLIRVLWDTKSDINEQSPPLQTDNFLNYITSCPNLKSCSWAATHPNELIGRRNDDLKGSSIHKPFPFLKHLALYQYYIGSQMWHGWQDHFNWSSLSSLEIGQGLFAPENLEVMTGRLNNLRSLRVTGNDIQNEELCSSLENFLVAFDTLVDLEILNCFVPVHAITRHSRLVNLCVHIGDTWNCQDSRAVFENADLISLDTLCPQLENLELDIERDTKNDDWPQDVLDTLACGFSRLKTIALHSRVGSLVHAYAPINMWGERHHPFKPKLTYKTAAKIGSNFFATRYRDSTASSVSTVMSDGSGRLQKLTLKCGLSKTMPIQLSGRMSERDAKFNTMTFDLLPPKNAGEEPELVHLEREHQEKLCHNCLSSTPHRVLEEIESIAEYGPRLAFRRKPGGGKTVCRRGPEPRVPRVATRRSERLAQRREVESTVD
ncbi:hypothetical protein AAEP93_011404 [Penicillium crustosum]